MSNKALLLDTYNHALDVVKADAIVSKNISLDKKNLTICNKEYPLKSINDLYCFSVGKAGLGMGDGGEGELGR